MIGRGRGAYGTPEGSSPPTPVPPRWDPVTVRMTASCRDNRPLISGHTSGAGGVGQSLSPSVRSSRILCLGSPHASLCGPPHPASARLLLSWLDWDGTLSCPLVCHHENLSQGLFRLKGLRNVVPGSTAKGMHNHMSESPRTRLLKPPGLEHLGDVRCEFAQALAVTPRHIDGGVSIPCPPPT